MKNDLDIEFQVLKKVVYDCSGIDINTTSRKREIVDQKKIFCLVAYNEMSASYSSVGRFMGLGHATIMHHVDNAFELLRYDKEFEKKTEISFDYWVGNKIGEIADFSSMYFDFVIMKFFVENNYPTDYLLDWYDLEIPVTDSVSLDIEDLYVTLPLTDTFTTTVLGTIYLINISDSTLFVDTANVTAIVTDSIIGVESNYITILDDDTTNANGLAVYPS